MAELSQLLRGYELNQLRSFECPKLNCKDYFQIASVGMLASMGFLNVVYYLGISHEVTRAE